MGRVIDLFIAYRFIRLLTTPFEKQKAYELGIIDEKGARTDKEIETSEEKSAYTVLHKLVFNIKRIFAKIPFLKSKLGTYAAALFLLKDTFKEEAEFERIEKYLMEEILKNPDILENTIAEDYYDQSIAVGRVILATEILLEDLETIAQPGDIVLIENPEPVGIALGMNIFQGKHLPSNQSVFISKDDIL